MVVGAGLAGLCCASDLVDAGWDVVVLEARDRVGGRVFSHRFTDGQTCERGAEFIDAAHTEVLALAASLGLALSTRNADIDRRQTLVDAAGRPVPMHLHASLADDLAAWDAAVASLQDGWEPWATLADLMSTLRLSAIGRLVIGREIRTEYMLPPDEVSQEYAAMVSAPARQEGRETHRVVGGNDQLASGLAARLGDRVRLGAVVRRLDAASGAVELADGTLEHGDAVVLAVPVSVLSRLWDDVPPSLGAVGVGVGGKISMQFRRRIWLDYGRNGTVLSDRQWGHLWETTDDQPGDTGVLTNLIASHDGAAFVSLPDAADTVLREIERVFPGAAGLVGERVHTDWTNDPWSLGCYSCFGVGQWSPAQAAAAHPYGRLWLAGEYADEFAGYMEGALRSGRRVAAAIALTRPR